MQCNCMSAKVIRSAVVAVDLNDFKLVNDNLGHPVGDDLLIGVAHRLLQLRSRRRHGRPAGRRRVRGVWSKAAPTRPNVVGRRVVEAFEEPFLLGGHELLMRPSVGLAIAEPRRTGPFGRGTAAARRHRDVHGEAVAASRCADLQPGDAVGERGGRQAAVRPARAAVGWRAAPRRSSCSGSFGRRSTTPNSPWSTSRSSTCAPPRSSAWRRCCAGLSPTGGCWRRRSSCRWSAGTV